MQCRIAPHQSFDSLQVVRVYRQFELSNLRKRIDVRLQFRPTRKAVSPSDLELRGSERFSLARLEQILCLSLQMPEIRFFWKRTRHVLGTVGHGAASFHRSARRPHIRLKEGSRFAMNFRWASALSADRMRP